MFEGVAADGTRVSLGELLGRKNVVLYFYPKDFTAVCTREACLFRDAYEELAAADTVVIGVSLDDASTHRRFAEEHKLNFVLLADEGGAIAKAYGAVGMLGGLLSMARRVTFVIDKQGIIRGVFRHELSAQKHLDDVRAQLASLP